MNEELAATIGADYVRTNVEAARFAVNGVTPGAVVAPGSRDDTAALVRLARERGWSIVPYGGGTQVETGFPPRSEFLALCTARLNRIVDYQPDDMTVTVEPGVTLAQLADTLAKRGQFLPLNPPLPGRGTVGGTVAAAASGPWRAGYGTPRDWVIGCRVIGADGEEVRGGGQVVKNVAGYDLPKLYTGSWGTLGLLTEVTFKVLPHPGSSGAANVTLHSPDAVEQLAAAVMASDLQPASAELMALDGDEWGFALQFIHVPEAVHWQLEILQRLAADAGGQFQAIAAEQEPKVEEALRDFPGLVRFLAWISSTPSRVAELAARAASVCLDEGMPPRVRAHVLTGQVYVGGDNDVPETFVRALRELAEGAGGTCVFRRLPAALIGKVDPWGPAGPEHRLTRGIKEALDPAGVFSPGRFVGGL